MANIKSAKKRIDTNKRQKDENKYVKSTLATYVKSFRKLIADGKIAEAEKKLNETISYIDSSCSKGVIHKNNASRKVSRLSSALYKAKAAKTTKTVAKAPTKKVEEVKVEVAPVVAEPVKAEVKPAPAKKETAKKVAKVEEKVPAKKTVAKKEAAPKKAVEKKAPAKKAVAEKKETAPKKAPAKKTK